MRAYVLNAVGKLNYEERKTPVCNPGWAIVKVKAAGICSSDIPRIFSKGTYHFPTIPGHEFSGIVDKVGDNKDIRWIGKRVGVFPLIPCRKCEQCIAGHYEMCGDYDYIGSRRDGGFAEEVAVPIWNLIELGDKISYETGAMLEPFSVALHAMKQATIKPGNSVAIIGTGMIACAAAQWARKLGAKKVTIIGRNEFKRKLVESLGVAYELTDKEFLLYDIVLEAVGNNSAIDKAINLCKPAGKLVLMGNPEGNVTLQQDSYWRILRKQLNIVGTWNSIYECAKHSDWTEVISSLNNNEINSSLMITHRFFQTDLKEGLMLMKNHKETYCKVMTIWNEE